MPQLGTSILVISWNDTIAASQRLSIAMAFSYSSGVLSCQRTRSSKCLFMTEMMEKMGKRYVIRCFWLYRYRIPVIPPRCCAPTNGFSVQKASTEQPESSALPCRTTITRRTKQYQTGQRVEEGTLDSAGHRHLSTALLMGLCCSLRGSAVLAQSICQWKDFIPVQCQCSNYSNITFFDK